MNYQSFKYSAYKSLLENKIDEEEYDLISEELGFFKRLGAKWAAAKGTASSIKKAYNDSQMQELIDRMSSELLDTIEQIRAIGNKLDIDESQVNDLIANSINAMMKQVQISPSDIANPPSLEAGGDQSSSSQQAVAAGQPLNISSIANNQQLMLLLLQALGEFKGMSAKNAAEAGQDAIEKDSVPEPEEVFDKIAVAVSAMTKVDVKNVEKVRQWLMKNGHLEVDEPAAVQAAEGFQNLSLMPLLVELNKNKKASSIITENLINRWSFLAGTLSESVATAFLKQSLPGIQTTAEFDEDFDQMKNDSEWDVSGWKELLNYFKELESHLKSLGAEDRYIQDIKEEIKDVIKEKENVSSEAKEAQKTFSSLIQKISDEIKDVPSESIAEVLSAFDKIAAFKIKP